MNGVQADEPQKLHHAITARGMRKRCFMHIERLRDDVLDPIARAERGVGILKHDLQRAPLLAQRRALELRQVGAVESH